MFQHAIKILIVFLTDIKFSYFRNRVFHFVISQTSGRNKVLIIRVLEVHYCTHIKVCDNN